jgi:uncharacterized membrane protein
VSRGGHAHPKTWPGDRRGRARIIGEWLKTEARYLASCPAASRRPAFRHDQMTRPTGFGFRGLGMISALIHIALISAKAVLALIATILIVPGLGIAAMVWYMRRWRARKLRPQIALEALNQRYALGDIGRTEYLQNRDDILAAQRTASAASAGSRQ